MKVAVAVWNDRVSPLLDSAERVLVADVEGGKATERTIETLGPAGPAQKVSRLTSLGVDVLVCGAVSQPVAAIVQSAGIQLVPWTAGQVEDVLLAFLEGRLEQSCFSMPGCNGFPGSRLRPGLPSHTHPRGPQTGVEWSCSWRALLQCQ